MRRERDRGREKWDERAEKRHREERERVIQRGEKRVDLKILGHFFILNFKNNPNVMYRNLQRTTM